VRKKFVLRGLIAAGAMVLSTAGVAFPASAAPVSSSHLSVNASPERPASGTGQQLCTSNGVMCLQRITSVANGSAYVEVWADTITWTGWLALYGPDGHIANYPASGVHTFERGGPGKLWDLPVGSGYYVIAWQNGPNQIARINFSVNNG
jgi:hypothetical protein